MRDRTDSIAWGLGVVCVATAAVLAATTGKLPEPRPMNDEQAQDAYRTVVGQERTMREKAMSNFLADRWSQDDDFASAERGAVSQYAASHDVSRQDVFRAIDRGLREDWSLPPGSQEPRVSVAPCRPRPIY
ncbi:hypothetical protein [Hyalangium versicolor]|uniref:hypothetical protein n=1 Tax=Hyalangium versicolor TaxID=2861190 RepID=UPI001CCA8F5F|nr:hypothetical protein [Hyalangium versicolor]